MYFRITYLYTALGCWAAVAPAHAQPSAYVVSSAVNTVTEIRTATDSVAGTVTTVAGPSRVAFSPNGAKAYVSHPALGMISVIDTATRSVTGTITTPAGPGALAVTPDGQHLFVATPGAVQVIALATGALINAVPAAGTANEIAFNPDGSRAYLAAGLLSVVDVASGTATSTSIPATSIAVMPGGQKLYAASSSGLREVDTRTSQIVRSLPVNGTPGPLALTPDGSRLYAGVQGFSLVSSTYGTFSVAFRNVTVYDTASASVAATISINAPATRLEVTPDRSSLYMLIPASSVAVADINTNRVRLTIPVGSGLSGLAIAPNPGGGIKPYLIRAVNDTSTVTTVSSTGGTPIANVLANDTLGGLPATLSNVRLQQISSTTTGVSLDVSTGAVVVAPGAEPGPHAVVYQICEAASPANCAQATASVNVRLPYVINAADDTATANPGITALNVLANDTLNALPATTATVRLTLLSADAGLTLGANGAVTAASGAPMGPRTLTYRICEIASPANCDSATVTINLIPYVVDAVNDSGAARRSGGLAVANVLANDRFGTGPAVLTKVRLSLVSRTGTGIVLNPATGAVTVTAGTPLGTYSLVYRICEIASPANCDDAAVSVTVDPYLIDAVNDYARASSKAANTAVASVLANDTLGGVRATVSTVRLSLVSISPANSQIRLDLADGSVDILGKTESGPYTLVYRICEAGNPSNCDQAAVTLDLSGSGSLQ